MIDGAIAAGAELEWLRPLTAQLDDAERDVFRALIAACPVGHFRTPDAPLLGAYCRAAVLERVTAAQMKADILNTPATTLKLYERATKTLAALSSKLRVCPQARLGANAKKSGLHAA
jgi:hypothetical protein